jgi:hypothetical protein
MLLKNLIKNIPKDKKNIIFLDFTNSKEVKKNYIFFALKEIKLMVKNLLKKQLKRCISNCLF